jgi:hypothetical protein
MKGEKRIQSNHAKFEDLSQDVGISQTLLINGQIHDFREGPFQDKWPARVANGQELQSCICGIAQRNQW